MEPATFVDRVFDTAVGRVYFRRWLQQSIDALARKAAESTRPA
jgi:hypothetical protein